MSKFDSCLFSKSNLILWITPDREIITELSLSYEECDENRSITNHLFGMILNIMETATELNTLESPANGTDDREARSFRWYAARTQMNCERKAEMEFRNIAKETYLPIQEEIHQWSDRKKKVQRLVIPMIIFVKMHCDDVKNIHHTAHFYGFIGSDRHNTQPAAIPEKDIETLRYMLGQSTSPVSIEPLPITLGDKVLINRGNLKGLEGYVMAYSKGSAHICIKLDLLGCAKVNISISDITKI